MSDTTTTETNGTATPAAKASPMVAIRAKFEADGGKFKDGKPVPTTAQLKAAKAASKDLTTAVAEVEKSEAALEAAKARVYDASQKVMEATGGVAVTIGGRELVPMSKGDRVYFRGAGNRASVDLG